MTPKQHQLLEWLRQWFRAHEYGPSYDEIAAALGICKSNVHRCVALLRRDGYLVREAGVRGLRLTAKGWGKTSPLAAARALIEDGIISEDENTGHAVVDMNRLGALELALKGDGPLKMPAMAAE
jgi:DNA-binding IclR family transcriptional regulator